MYLIANEIQEKCSRFGVRVITVVISERLFKIHQIPGEKLVEHGNLVLVAGYQTALAYASATRLEITILGDENLLHEITNYRGNDIDRILLVRVDGIFEGTIHFTEPILGNYFTPVYQDPWPADQNNPYDSILYVYWKKSG